MRTKRHVKCEEGNELHVGNVMLGAVRLSGAGNGELGSVYIVASDAASGNNRADSE